MTSPQNLVSVCNRVLRKFNQFIFKLNNIRTRSKNNNKQNRRDWPKRI